MILNSAVLSQHSSLPGPAPRVNVNQYSDCQHAPAGQVAEDRTGCRFITGISGSDSVRHRFGRTRVPLEDSVEAREPAAASSRLLRVIRGMSISQSIFPGQQSHCSIRSPRSTGNPLSGNHRSIRVARGGSCRMNFARLPAGRQFAESIRTGLRPVWVSFGHWVNSPDRKSAFGAAISSAMIPHSHLTSASILSD